MKLFIFSLLELCNVLLAGAAQLRQQGRTGIFHGNLGSSSSRSEGLLQRRNATSQALGKSSPSLKLTLANHNGIQYTAAVLLGGQELRAIYDTGSFEVMAISKECSICELHSSQHAYDSSTSKSYRKGTKGSERHFFAGGTVLASEDYETVEVGKAGSNVKVDNMPFWQVTKTDMQVFLNKKANFTAIVGMGHRKKRVDSDAESLVERVGIDKFSICLLPGLANPGYLTFNPEHNLADTAFSKLIVTGDKHWSVDVDQVSTDLNGTPLHSCWIYGGQQKCAAIIDSGTSLIGVPPNAAVMVKTLIKRIKYDCSNLDELPDLVFFIGGKRFALPARAYTVHFGLVNGKPSRCLPAFTDVSMSLKGANIWILGLPFLRHFYTVFDRAGPSIYVADQGENCSPALKVKDPHRIDALIDVKGPHRKPQLPTIADLSQALLPSWAHDNELTQL